MEAKDEEEPGSDFATGTDNNDDSSSSNSEEEEGHEGATFSDVEKRLRTVLKENRKLRRSLRRKDNQIYELNMRVEELTCGKDATAIFPEEIWRIILGNLTDPQDLWRSSKTCQLFADILSKWWPGRIMEVALPHLYRHLTRNELLECRLVCPGWNKKINSFLEDHPSLRPRDPDVNSDPRMLEYVNPVLEKGLCDRNVYNFWNQDCNPDLQLTFNGNPFLGRYVTLIMCKGFDEGKPQEETVTRLYEKIYTFLGLYGKEIFYLNVWYHAWDEDLRNGVDLALEKSKLIQLITVDLFHFVPNLRKLRVGGVDRNVSENVNIPPESLPPAPMLESLELNDDVIMDEREPIFHALLVRYHSQLCKIHVKTFDWNEEVCGLDWPMLTELNIRVLGGRYWSLRRIECGMPSLRKLGLDLTYFGTFTFYSLMKGFDELSSTTRLDTIRLTGILGFQNDGEEPGACWVAPPTIQTLELDNCLVTGPDCSYNFLLLRHFPHIKNLHIFLRTQPRKYQSEVELNMDCEGEVSYYIKRERPDETVEINKFLGSGAPGGGNMYESNIWELMHNLNVFTFQLDVYTRDGYEKYSRKKNLRIQNQIVT